MPNVNTNLAILADTTAMSRVEAVWTEIDGEFEAAYSEMPSKFMERTELTFHSFVKLLGYLCIDLEQTLGDILEIGVWKGRSLALMNRLSQASTHVIGVDPCALLGQEQELNYFHQSVFPNAKLIVEFSERAVAEVVRVTDQLKILHIDGGHDSHNVWADFLLYERFVVPGGYVVFDDYADDVHSPDVKIAVDELQARGLFRNFEVIGPVTNYENSFLLKRLSV